MMEKQDTRKLLDLQNKYADVLGKFYDVVKELSVDKKYINCKATTELLDLGDRFMEVEDALSDIIMDSIHERQEKRQQWLEKTKKELDQI